MEWRKQSVKHTIDAQGNRHTEYLYCDPLTGQPMASRFNGFLSLGEAKELLMAIRNRAAVVLRNAGG